MKVSFLTITNRDAFEPWVRASVAGQRMADVELEHVIMRCKDANLGNARQAALESATGDYCVWHDDDDWWSPGRLARMLGPLRLDPSIDIVHDPINPDIRVDLKTGTYREHHYAVPIIHRDLLFRRPNAQPMDRTMRRFEDAAWLAKLLNRRDLRWLQLPYRNTPMRFSLEHDANVSEKRDDTIRNLGPFPFDDSVGAEFRALQKRVYP